MQYLVFSNQGFQKLGESEYSLNFPPFNPPKHVERI